MYKLKTNRSIKKRFKITTKGKILRRKACKSHLLQKKSSNEKRKLRKVAIANLSDKRNFVRSLPYIYMS
uniref:Large ribosomal subunit protein bL35c n=1 Tax=Polysiphonia sertularioides TaxID=945028 RepID=A0A1Z1MGK8_9FLOR|nr:ribosomal protein L35 [Polysiphonia sertularioides]